MALGDASASDSTIATQVSDAGAAQQQLAYQRFSPEANTSGPAPVGNSAMVASLPDFGLINPSAAGAGASDSLAAKLDTTKSVVQLEQAGVIQQVEAPAGAARTTDAAAQTLKPGESPQVTVTYSDANTGANQKTPDFIVKQDGTIQATGDPQATNNKNVVIQVERAPGTVASPAANQQQSIDGLVNYLKDRYSTDNPAVAQNGLNLNDQYGLISPDVAQTVGAKATAPDAAATTAAARQNFAPQTQQAMSQGSRFTPGSSGQVSRGDIDNMVPERTQPRAQNETESIADMKNAIAAEYRPDAATKTNPNAPYETQRMDRVGTSEVPTLGRYGMSYNIFRGWFGANCGGGDNFDFDDDTIVEKMDNLAKHGKVSKAFAAKFHNPKFAHSFVHLMHQMKAGHMPSSEEMSKLPGGAQIKDLMPAEFQEQVAADMVGKFAQQAHGDAGKVALAFHLGKSPDQLTTPETADAGNLDYQRTAKTFAGASHLRDGMGATGTANYTVGQDGTLIDQKLKQAAISTAESMGGAHSEHLCATGAQVALAKVGQGEFMGSGNGFAMHKKFDSSPDWVRVDSTTMHKALAKGHVGYVCRQWANDPGGAGHVELLSQDSSGKIMGASDFYGVHNPQNNYYNWRNDHFYLPKADVEQA
jgi:hypothetical protein